MCSTISVSPWLKIKYNLEVNFSFKVALMFQVLSPHKVTQVTHLSYFTVIYLTSIYFNSPTLSTNHSKSLLQLSVLNTLENKNSYFAAEAILSYCFPPSQCFGIIFFLLAANINLGLPTCLSLNRHPHVSTSSHLRTVVPLLSSCQHTYN